MSKNIRKRSRINKMKSPMLTPLSQERLESKLEEEVKKQIIYFMENIEMNKVNTYALLNLLVSQMVMTKIGNNLKRQFLLDVESCWDYYETSIAARRERNKKNEG